MSGNTATSNSAEWELVAATVAAGRDELAVMTTPKQLYTWAKTHDLATKTKFPKFKIELRKQLDIDYEQLREQSRARFLEELTAAAASGPRMELWAAGDDEVSSFAVCDDENVLWYGEFSEHDRTYTQGDQHTADLSAAVKAIWLAGQARHDADATAARLLLHVTNPLLGHDELREEALKARLVLDLDVTVRNPALEWCRENGYKSWREVRLSSLLQPPTAA